MVLCGARTLAPNNFFTEPDSSCSTDDVHNSRCVASMNDRMPLTVYTPTNTALPLALVDRHVTALIHEPEPCF